MKTCGSFTIVNINGRVTIKCIANTTWKCLGEKRSTINNYSGITGTYQDCPRQMGTIVTLIISDYLISLGNFFSTEIHFFFLMHLNLALTWQIFENEKFKK